MRHRLHHVPVTRSAFRWLCGGSLARNRSNSKFKIQDALFAGDAKARWRGRVTVE
jgi:hypothetical protein